MNWQNVVLVAWPRDLVNTPAPPTPDQKLPRWAYCDRPNSRTTELMRLGTAIDLHLQHVKPLLTPATVRQRRYDLERFAAHVGPDTAVKALKATHILDWLNAQNVRASTLHLRFGTVRYFIGDAQRHGWIKGDPTLGIVLPRRPRKEPRALTSDELAALGRVLPDERARLIIALSINEALRRVEICRLELDDFDFTGMRLRVVTAKAGSEDVIPLSHDTHDRFLTPYLGIRGRQAGPLIRSYIPPHRGLTPGAVTSLVGKWFRAAGIKEAPYDGRSLHAGRHTKASALLDAGASPEIVQKYLRHSQMSSTWTYLRNRRSVEDLKPWAEANPGHTRLMSGLMRIAAAGLIVAVLIGWAAPAEAKPPKPCVTALDAGQQVIMLNAEEAKNVSDYFGALNTSASRNSSGGITGVTAYLTDSNAATKDLTAKTNDLTARVQAAVAVYNAAAAKCRKS